MSGCDALMILAGSGFYLLLFELIDGIGYGFANSEGGAFEFVGRRGK